MESGNKEEKKKKKELARSFWSLNFESQVFILAHSGETNNIFHSFQSEPLGA